MPFRSSKGIPAEIHRAAAHADREDDPNSANGQNFFFDDARLDDLIRFGNAKR